MSNAGELSAEERIESAAQLKTELVGGADQRWKYCSAGRRGTANSLLAYQEASRMPGAPVAIALLQVFFESAPVSANYNWTKSALPKGHFTYDFTEAGLKGSIASVGEASDNAMMESTNGLYITELIDVYPTRAERDAEEVETVTASWVYW